MDAHMQSRGSWSPWDEIDWLKAENERLRSILQEMLRHGQTTVSKKRIKAALIDGLEGGSEEPLFPSSPPEEKGNG